MTFTCGRAAASLLLPLAAAATFAGCGSSTSADTAPPASTSKSTKPSSRAVDQAFVRQMIPHHRLAVQMAKVALVNGDHPEIKDLAAAIVKTQNEEITELTQIGTSIGANPDTTGSAMTKDAATLGLKMDAMGMSMDMHGFAEANPFDLAFVDGMTPHHQGAIAMAKAQLAGGADPRLKTIAKAIIAAQEEEMTQMAAWRKQWYPAATTPAATGSRGGHDMSGMPGM